MILEVINVIVVVLGIPTILGAFIFIGKKLNVLEYLDKDVDKIKHNVKVISDHLTRNSKKFNPAELQAHSPYQLTEQGYKLIRDIGFEEVFEKNKDKFFEFIESEEDISLKYDVEVAAIKSIHALSDEPYMKFLKIFLYNNPNRDLKNIAPTLGVYVRDKYLSEHPEINE